MSLKIGIVGLPNVGKSTLFNALIKGSIAAAENYPFCTIEPNVGIIEVPDERLEKLTQVSESKNKIPAVVEFVDIAGLVKGASEGEGLGNKFLAHIRECDAVAMVVRFFEDKNVQHISQNLDPKGDIAVIETELQLADLEIVEKRLKNVEGEIKAGSKNASKEKETLLSIKKVLEKGENARTLNLEDEKLKLVKSLSLLTLKPILYVANVSEEQLSQKSHPELVSGSRSRNEFGMTDARSDIRQRSFANAQDDEGGRRAGQDDEGGRRAGQDDRDNFIPISAKIESELNELSESEKMEYLKTLGIKNSGRDELIRKAYEILGLITFFTSGEPETRAWTVLNGAKAPQAAGVIHTDFEHGFISAEVIDWQNLVDNEGWTNARAKGLVRTEGKDYTVKDGDVCLFRFNV